MTIGMLVESLTSKLGALAGHFVDATPFQKCEKPDTFVNPIEEFGSRLEQAGFAKHGGTVNVTSPYLCCTFIADMFTWVERVVPSVPRDMEDLSSHCLSTVL